jgi:hypothetical protein
MTVKQPSFTNLAWSTHRNKELVWSVIRSRARTLVAQILDAADSSNLYRHHRDIERAAWPIIIECNNQLSTERRRLNATVPGWQISAQRQGF